MPKIYLKPKSPEFADSETRIEAQPCDMPGCPSNGEYKAPKHRGLDDHFLFCVDHVREYNQAWDFFSGMSPNEVEDHMMSSLYGDRPTWRYDTDAAAEDILGRETWKTYHFTDGEPPPRNGQQNGHHSYGLDKNAPEFEALAILGLEPPLTSDIIKARYKELAKKHHPDLNHGDPKSEELLKRINMAYTILKLAFDKFDQLEKQ